MTFTLVIILNKLRILDKHSFETNDKELLVMVTKHNITFTFTPTLLITKKLCYNTQKVEQ